ncbi:MAG: hypothetical protein A2898_02235 [Candidatus Kerfeldbacteria bacterium RIFCSPLOWO2_01_FULL_48_11]|uniref:Uncharacterized protein n=1 Tax=Candidatus Kerfeldbacteria bacterium RIFCSPLOWO2_01_FULL_48_11 TaxID=1798543 RepID=A0A1G2B4C5_9BACT|nr:MAG: hypothetical protein UY34_C0015G0011 [Parcubacteria group bacterium GW2011_GWA2_48_9]KKW16378.1 MAG: hypothetical protein UY52_C0005G0013 [Parcubacteria group bacterium GW2011_GWC2_49_9]OGY83077.1 MAG: hypothetical protein A2898_02235 [Candidatus Kerfeldbacteria bacterium RIFCSPLOWO2_01_FULL_48_11]
MALSRISSFFLFFVVAVGTVALTVFLSSNGSSNSNAQVSLLSNEGSVAGVSVNTTDGQVLGSSDENPFPPSSERVETVPEKQISAPTFKQYFTVAYLGRFIGIPEPPPSVEFSKEDNIVLVVRIPEGLKTNDTLTMRIMKDNQLVSESPPIEILSGEIGIKNPGKRGRYVVELRVRDQSIFSLPFSIT